MIIAYTTALLTFSFAIHVMWWRQQLPANTTKTLLLIFFGILAASILTYSTIFNATIISQLQNIIKFILLYSSCALVYIILYSAIEQQSPTLAIVDFINKHGNNGCDTTLLHNYLNANGEIEKRLALMTQSDWITASDHGWHLTKRGRRIAGVFQFAATVFGLNKGG